MIGELPFLHLYGQLSASVPSFLVEQENLEKKGEGNRRGETTFRHMLERLHYSASPPEKKKDTGVMTAPAVMALAESLNLGDIWVHPYE